MRGLRSAQQRLPEPQSAGESQPTTRQVPCTLQAQSLKALTHVAPLDAWQQALSSGHSVASPTEQVTPEPIVPVGGGIIICPAEPPRAA